MKKIHIAEISLAVALVVSVLFSIVGFGFECNDIRNDVLRLHILANSDNEKDQQVKLAVRDALLNCGNELFSGYTDKENAKIILKKEEKELTDAANKVLKENGFDYEACIYLAEEYFTTRSYESFTLPAGEYLALKVILGKGDGRNWWCVMFPPLCLPAATDKTDLNLFFGENGTEIIQNTAKYELRFKIVEIFEELKHKYF